MVTIPELGDCLEPLLTCLEDGNSPPEDKTDAYLRLAEDLAKDDKQFVKQVCDSSMRLLSVLTRDFTNKRTDLSQAALQAVGYCLYHEQVVSSLEDDEMSKIIHDLCNVVVDSQDKNMCTRALWSIGKQNLSVVVVENKLPVILQTVEHALVTFASTTVEKEALEVIYRLLTQLPNRVMTSAAGQWSKLVYPLLISPAHKIREKALGILELGLKPMLLAREEVVVTLLPDLRGGLLSELTEYFGDKKEVFVLRTWSVLITILGEALHKSGSLINDMLKIPEQGFKSSSSDVQSMCYNTWICLIDNFATSPAFIGAIKKIRLLMMPLLLSPVKVIHKDIELSRLQAWWHLVCTIKTYFTGPIFSEVCVPLLQYYFSVNNQSGTTPLGYSKDGMQDLVLPVTPITSARTTSVVSASPVTTKSKKTGTVKKSVTLNKAKFSDTFVKQVMLLGCEMLMEILAFDDTVFKKSKRLTEHLDAPILQSSFFQENELFLFAVVKSALHSCAKDLEDSVALSIWTNTVNHTVYLVQNGYGKNIDDLMAPLFLTAHDILTYTVLDPHLILKFLEVLAKLPPKYLIHPFAFLPSPCYQGKPIFLLADILFSQLSSFNGSYVEERFHVVFESLIDACLEAPLEKLTNVHNVWSSLEGLMSNVANVEDMWRFWSKVTDSVSEYVMKTSDVNQGDALEHDFSLMISLLTFPFEKLFAGGLPGATTKELDRDLAELFQLFSRCASVVPSAEANTCIEELSNSMLPVVSEEKCKNLRFLDSISYLINVMMECVDFSVQNDTSLPTRSTRGSLTPTIKPKRDKNPLGNLNGLLSLSAKVLNISHKVDQDSSGSIVIAPAVMALAGALSKLFAYLTSPQKIKASIQVLSKPLASFFSRYHSSFNVQAENRSSDKKYSNAKFFLKMEKLWTDILTCLQSHYTAAFDSELLETMSELLESTFCHPRRQLRNQTIMFWNATFSHTDHLDYSASLRSCLKTVMEKTPICLPGWDKSKVASLESPVTLQDSEEMTPKENIIKPQVVMVNSPKRKHGASSPGKLKGSFLHKTFSADKTGSLSPFKSNIETSTTKRKSPAGANVRRKLPLSLDCADDKDFVVIAPSPKKKRLLTEHQKEVRKAKKFERDHPSLYNAIDQSQDGTHFSEWSQSLSIRNLEVSEEKMDLQTGNAVCQQMDANKKTAQRNSNGLPDDSAHRVTELSESLRDNQPRENNDVDRSADEFERKNLDETNNSNNDDVNMNCDEGPPSPEFIPSSQTVNSDLNHVHFIKRSSTQGLCKTHPGCSSEISSDSESDVKEIESVNSETSKIKSPRLEGIKKGRSSQNLKNINSPLVESKKNSNLLTKTSPTSSRTRLKDKPTDSSSLAPKTKTTDDVAKSFYFSLERKREIGHMPDDNKPQTPFNTEEEHSDHQLDDTQILEETTARNFVKVAPVIATIESKNQLDFDKIVKECETPSSPIASSSVKLVHSKSPIVSPLRRPTRAFGSPAASPTTGILKRNKGRVDTPSPPEKTRHVSFAFPLREEKEISRDPLEQDFVEEASSSIDQTSTFTAIKATPTRALGRKFSSEDCVFPDLVECSTPVEQILPSLTTSRWSRGLGHLVHAQNIRTVGNLSALTEDQVEKLPIRSPKVSTLRRVLRNFQETLALKSPKVNQQREIVEVVDEEKESSDSGVIDGKTSEVQDETSTGIDSTSNVNITKDSEKLIVGYDNGDRGVDENESEPKLTVSTTVSSESGLSGNHEKMLTPKRARFLVKPTTLFGSEDHKMKHQARMSNYSTDKRPIDELRDNHLMLPEEVEASSPVSNYIVVPVEDMDVQEEHLDNDKIPFQPSSEVENNTSNKDCEMPVKATIPSKDSLDPFAAALGNLVDLKTEEELGELPFETLFFCHEQLTTLLSNVASAIKSKCG